MYFDIRSVDAAIKTLERLTGVERKIWEFERIKNSARKDFSSMDKDIKKVIEKNNGKLPKLSNIEFVIVHITTSKNKCSTILEKGIVDLRKAYENTDGELRAFLEQKGVEIFINEKKLKYREKTYEIYGDDCPNDSESEEYKAWSIGHRFYYDFTVCGFLSINKKDVYGGNIHLRPEILYDIDMLLRTDFSNEWRDTHMAYEVVFKVSSKNVIYDGCDMLDEYEKVIAYLSIAYMCACKGPRTEEVLCVNNIEISPKQIIECNEFTAW